MQVAKLAGELQDNLLIKIPSFDGRNGSKMSKGREGSGIFREVKKRRHVLKVNPFTRNEGAGKYHLIYLILTLSAGNGFGHFDLVLESCLVLFLVQARIVLYPLASRCY